MACYELMGPPSARDLARKDDLCRRHPPQNWPADCDEALSSHSFIDQIRGFGLQSSLNSTCLRRCRRSGSSRVTVKPEVIPEDPIRTMTSGLPAYQELSDFGKNGLESPGLKGVDDKQQIEARSESTSRA